jgi:predicted GNAT superfamily acetyltransferase
MEEEIRIEPMSTQADLRACEDIQRAAWQMEGDDEVVPDHMLRAIRHYGGVLLGAYTPEGQMVGFVCGFIGRTEDEKLAKLMGTPFLHYSHMMGIHPDYQGRSIGARLKRAQREHALKQGDRLMMWTYDPLLGPNAHLNIEKLGVICRRYVRDAYGDLEGIYLGLPTDRFEVEWWIASRYVQNRLKGPVSRVGMRGWLKAGAQPFNPSVLRSDGLRAPGTPADKPNARVLLVEIPGDFNAIREADMELARDWRLHIREVCEVAFEAKYVASRFVSEVVGGERRNFYLLMRGIDFTTTAEGHDDHED